MKIEKVHKYLVQNNNINNNSINVNESGLVNHIKEVLKGESAKNLMNKLNFNKAVTMKNKSRYIFYRKNYKWSR